MEVIVEQMGSKPPRVMASGETKTAYVLIAKRISNIDGKIYKVTVKVEGSDDQMVKDLFGKIDLGEEVSVLFPEEEQAL